MKNSKKEFNSSIKDIHQGRAEIESDCLTHIDFKSNGGNLQQAKPSVIQS